MSKASVTRLFIVSLLAATSGAAVAIAGIWVAIANDVFVMRGADIVGIQGSALAWVLLGVALAGAITLTAGIISGFVSWIGALLATAQLQRKTWFVGLLVLGICNLGLFGMIAYLAAGPDGRISTPTSPSHPASAAVGA
jgi:hypothetical protein